MEQGNCIANDRKGKHLTAGRADDSSKRAFSEQGRRVTLSLEVTAEFR